MLALVPVSSCSHMCAARSSCQPGCLFAMRRCPRLVCGWRSLSADPWSGPPPGEPAVGLTEVMQLVRKAPHVMTGCLWRSACLACRLGVRAHHNYHVFHTSVSSLASWSIRSQASNQRYCGSLAGLRLQQLRRSSQVALRLADLPGAAPLPWFPFAIG